MYLFFNSKSGALCAPLFDLILYEVRFSEISFTCYFFFFFPGKNATTSKSIAPIRQARLTIEIGPIAG